MCAKTAAQHQCDKHIVKMALEICQLLSTAVRILEPKLFAENSILYKITHKNHPMSIWVRTSRQNFEWTIEHGLELFAEF